MKEKCSIDEFTDSELREELEFRGFNVTTNEELEGFVGLVCGDNEEVGYFLKKDFFGYELRDHLLDITGQGGWVSDEELFSKLRELIK